MDRWQFVRLRAFPGHPAQKRANQSIAHSPIVAVNFLNHKKQRINSAISKYIYLCTICHRARFNKYKYQTNFQFYLGISTLLPQVSRSFARAGTR